MRSGRAILERIPEISPEFLLKRVTGVARRDWAAALSNLWVVVEQITSHLWEKRVLTPARADRTVGGRLDQLSDNRTWTVATRPNRASSYFDCLSFSGIRGSVGSGSVLRSLASPSCRRYSRDVSRSHRSSKRAQLTLREIEAKRSTWDRLCSARSRLSLAIGARR